MLQRLKFLFQSTNEHGVHSPFVFNYITKCLYAKPKLAQPKTGAVLIKSIAYFGCQRFWVQEESLKNRILKNFPSAQFDALPIDLAFFTQLDTLKVEELLQGQLHNDSLILVDAIRGNNMRWKLWQEISARPQITVSMDLFFCGLWFVRSEQEKEHFKIRC